MTVIILGQWFLHLSIHQNCLEGLLKYSLLGLTLRVSDSVCLSWCLRMCISGEYPGDSVLLTQEPHFENHTCKRLELILSWNPDWKSLLKANPWWLSWRKAAIESSYRGGGRSKVSKKGNGWCMLKTQFYCTMWGITEPIVFFLFIFFFSRTHSLLIRHVLNGPNMVGVANTWHISFEMSLSTLSFIFLR